MPDENDKVRVDEERKLRQHEQVKGEIREEIHREIRNRAEHVAPADQARVEGVAEAMKQRAVREVAATESELAQARGIARVSQVADYLFYVLYGLIGLVVVLELLGARERNTFKSFLDAVTAPFLAPFKGLMPDPAIGSFQLMLSYIIALAVYVLLHMAVNGALRLLVSRKTVV